MRIPGSASKLVTVLVGLYCSVVAIFVLAQNDEFIVIDDVDEEPILIEDDDSEQFVIEVDDTDSEAFVIDVDNDDIEEESESFVLEVDEDESDSFVIEMDEEELDSIATDAEDSDSLLIEVDEEEVDSFVIEVDEQDTGTFEVDVDEEEVDSFVIEDEGDSDESFSIDVDEPDSHEISIGSDADEAHVATDQQRHTDATRIASASPSNFDARLDKVILEYAGLTDNDESVDGLAYANAEFSLTWDGGAKWEWRLAGRLGGYMQFGKPDPDDIEFDYGESYIRYRGESFRATLGAQTVIWGRIDEIPPSDRLSVQDLRRFLVDDLQDRRLARPMLRIESFFGDNAFDLIYTPTFRGAELADQDSIWYPIDRRRGELFGLEANPLVAQIIRGANIDDDAPDTDNGFGLRFSRTESSFDYALTVQRSRQQAPYFSYDFPTNTFRAQHPRAWSIGGDIGMELGGATWRFEAAWISDIPATREDNFQITEVEGINWALGVEFYPGDSDTRVNLQFAASNLDSSEILDRTEIYNINGEIDIPFAQERWRLATRFFFGLDEKDVYINPELIFMGWQPHSFYLELQYFDGDPGTIGGFHENHSMIAVGWRAEF